MTITPKWLGSDASHKEAFQRTLDVAGAGATLLQVSINKTVQQLHQRELGASAILPRMPGTGNAAYINRRTPGTDGQWLDDTTEPTSAEGSYAQVSFAYKTLVIRGTVTRKLQATGRSYGDVLGGEVSGRTGDFSDTFEKGLIVGDISADANQFDGLITLIQVLASQIVLQTTTAGGDAFTLDKLDETIDAVKGSAARADLVILASEKGRRILNGALQAQQQFNDMIDIAGGFRVRSYDGIAIVTTTQMPDIMTFNGSKITAFTGDTTTAYIVVNTRYVWIEELTSLTVMPLAKRSSQFDEFDLFWDGSLVLANSQGAAILAGIDVTA